MAGDWIKMRMDLPDDPAVYKLASLTKLDRFSVIGRLYAFWAWADRHAVDGRVDGATSTVVDDVVRHDGFAAAMSAVHWLEIGEEFVTIPNHDRHNGESAKERSLKNARQARWREKKDTNVDANVDGEASTKPSTREEKRREEKKVSINTSEQDSDLFAGIDLQVAADFKAMRKKMKAEITKTAIDGISREATIAGITLEDALRICCERGWRGFKAEWLANQKQAGSTMQQTQTTPSQRDIENQKAYELAFGKKQVEVIDV